MRRLPMIGLLVAWICGAACGGEFHGDGPDADGDRTSLDVDADPDASSEDAGDELLEDAPIDVGPGEADGDPDAEADAEDGLAEIDGDVDAGGDDDSAADADSSAEAEAAADADGVDGVETGPTDEDGDTVPAGEDCDDHDSSIVLGSTRPCSSACGTGVEYCSAGSWIGCDAPTDCTCSPPGSTRLVDCGRCGMASQRCGATGVWELPGACMYEGECFAAEVGTESCGMCGTHSRLCGATCAWMPWAACEEHGECAPGAAGIVRTGCPAGQIQQRHCDASCSWVVDVPCTTDCILPARAGTYNADICIPGGLFRMGSEETDPIYAARMPVHDVILSPYFIDRFPVTNGRYRACVEAGACPAPRNAGAFFFYVDRATYDSYPVDYLYRSDGIAFCAWDGGRFVPTEAQWEKASRGPAPRENLYPWGDDLDYCRYVNHRFCGTGFLVPVDWSAENVSFYGVRGMQGNITEFARDYYDVGYYAVSPLLDPEGPLTGTEFSGRGAHFRYIMDLDDGNYRPITGRTHSDGLSLYDALGFRCVRQPWSE